MTSFLRFLEVFALGTWVGGIIFLSFAVAPGAFAVLSSRHDAGAVVGYSLTRLHWYGIAAGLVYLAALMLERRALFGWLRPAAFAVILMIALTFTSQHLVSRRMTVLRAEMGSVDATPLESPLRVEFNRLHRASVQLEGATLLFGLAALLLTVHDFAK
ncbi:MAG TPA: DUF4149 domain-containing protein [Candidatus Acidoferrales bacterium]|nr:DUF4149 domain-containing protein [Candidatus Acidoferrales bacterium]